MKAQFWSFDLVFAMVLFSVTIVILVLVWSGINNQLSLTSNFGPQSMQLQAQAVAGRLLTPGTPVNWNSGIDAGNPSTWSGVSAGLSGGQGSLSQAKILSLESMSNLDYQATKPLLGVSYDYFITIKGNGVDMGIGLDPAQNGAVTVQSVTESALLNGEPVQVDVEVWTNSSLGTG